MRLVLKLFLWMLAGLVLLLAVILAWLWPRYDYDPPVPPGFSLERFEGNPVVSSELSRSLQAENSEGGYVNINGPSVVRVPDWVEGRLGEYYLYFAHHKGNHIRMAYADFPAGPWTLYEPGTLRLEDSGFPVTLEASGGEGGLDTLWRTFSIHVVRDYLLLAYRATVTDQEIRRRRGMETAANARPHIASPEVIVDHEDQQFLMFFHGYRGSNYQHSSVARSRNGIDFELTGSDIFSTYLRAFDYRGDRYLLGMLGILYRSAEAEGGFIPRDRSLFDPNMRHTSVWVEGEQLHVLWSRVGDAPESLLYSRVDMSNPDWDRWRASEGVVVMRPELPWEGSELPVQASLRGELNQASNELRDPFVLRDEDGSLYLYYVGSGEQAIGIARLVPD
jgi:hypothetical protein